MLKCDEERGTVAHQVRMWATFQAWRLPPRDMTAVTMVDRIPMFGRLKRWWRRSELFTYCAPVFEFFRGGWRYDEWWF